MYRVSYIVYAECSMLNADKNLFYGILFVSVFPFLFHFIFIYSFYLRELSVFLW